MALAVGVVACAGLAAGAPAGPRGLGVPLDALAAACSTANPFIAVACVDRVIVTQDTISDRPHYAYGARIRGSDTEVGAIWGIAYSSREQALYVGATHARGAAFGDGGPGGIYRIALADGQVSQPITVPDAGASHHLPSARGSDAVARYWTGKTSLGDLDLSEDESELFVTNLDDRHIYRFALPDGRLIGSFATGGLDEPWSDDARPWGLAVRAGVVYHAVVDSAEQTQHRGDLRVAVYASAPDGSNMSEVYGASLDRPRAKVQVLGGAPDTAWRPWRSISLKREMNVYAMPIASDIGFTASDDLVIGLKDRIGGMTNFGTLIFSGAMPPPPGTDTDEEFGMALGDVAFAERSGPGWSALETQRFLDDPVRLNWPQGGIAMADVERRVISGATVVQPFDRGKLWDPAALWFGLSAPEPVAEEFACLDPNEASSFPLGGASVHAAELRRPVADHTLIRVVAPPGDVEVLCPAIVHPTATPTETPIISPTPSSTRTASPTRTLTLTPTPTETETPTPSPTPSPTREPSPIYLPITLSEPQCLPIRPKLDVLLVLDASTSMRDLTRAGRPKIDAAVAAAHDFLARLALAPDGDHAGLVSFNAVATLDSPLTADRTALDAALARVALAQFTRIDLGLDAAAAELAGPRRRVDATAAVILLTDGRSNPVPVSEAERAAGVVKAAGARLFTIGLGQDVDAEALRAMASQAADYFEAPDGEDLGAIYGAISAALPCAPYPYWP